MKWLRDALWLARMDVGHLLRRRETLVWTFVMPIVFFYFIGTVTGNISGPDDSKDDLAMRVAPGAGFMADQLAIRLDTLNFRVVRTGNGPEFARYRRRLEIPDGFTEAVLAAKPVKIQFSRTGQDLNADFDQVRLTRAVNALLTELAVARKAGQVTAETLSKLAGTPRPLTVAVKPAGKRKEIPSGFDQSVPGTMVMFTLLVLFTTGGVTLTQERNQGILRRLASAPMSRGAVAAGKWGARMALGMVQISFAMITGTVLFRIHWGPNVGVVLIVLLCYGALAAAMGMVLGNLGRTEAQVVGVGVIVSNLLAGLGGCWWPIEVAPLWSQKLALFLPTGWTMDALHKLVNFGASPVEVLPHIAVTLAGALIAGFVVARTFRFQ